MNIFSKLYFCVKSFLSKTVRYYALGVLGGLSAGIFGQYGRELDNPGVLCYNGVAL